MIRILNTHQAYTEFRIERAEQIKEGKWNYIRLLLHLDAWSTNPDYAKIILRTIKSSLIPYPPILQQEKIVEKLDKLSKKTQHLEGIYQQKLSTLGELRQSVLQEAFLGRL